MNDPGLAIYTVYAYPRDFPDNYVVRRFMVRPGVADPIPDEKPYLVLVGTPQGLRTIREVLAAMGLYCIPRSRQDDPNIVESWV